MEFRADANIRGDGVKSRKSKAFCLWIPRSGGTAGRSCCIFASALPGWLAIANSN